MEKASQDFLQIKEIRDGVVILNNNQIRGILMVSATNFSLKSEEEQSAILGSFQDFLNSLDFFCQIIVQSRAINITPYIDSLKILEDKQPNELLKTQITSYIEFIKELVQTENVMTKNFYVIVPYSLLEMGMGGMAKQFGFGKKAGAVAGLSEEQFEKYKGHLWQRMEYLASGLRRCGLDCVPLATAELIELFWSIHHPDEAESGYYPEIPPELLR